MNLQNQFDNLVPADLAKLIDKYEFNVEESLCRMMDQHIKIITKTPPNLKELTYGCWWNNHHPKKIISIVESCGVLRYQDYQQYYNTHNNGIINKFIYIYKIVPDISYHNTHYADSVPSWVVVEIDHRVNDNKNDDKICWVNQYGSLQELFTNAYCTQSKTISSLCYQPKRINWSLMRDYYIQINSKSFNNNNNQPIPDKNTLVTPTTL